MIRHGPGARRTRNALRSNEAEQFPVSPFPAPSMDHAPPTFVRERKSQGGTDSSAPRRANSGRAPVGAIVRSTRSPRIIEQAEQNRSTNRTTYGALDHAGSARDSAAQIEAAH